MDKVFIITTTILLFSIVVIVILERKFPYRKGLPFFREGFWVDLIWYTLIQSYFLKIFIFDYIILPLDKHYHLSGLNLIGSWPLFWQVVFFVVLHDLYIYWFHYWQHKSKLLWRTHEAHHSNKQVDWLAGSRSHSLEILINQTIEFAPIILLGANPLVVPIKALIDAVWGMYIHSNINVKSGKFKYFINGPEMHQWHHSNHNEVFFANYSTKLSVWDWLFKTAYYPNKKPVEFGLPYSYPKDYFLQHFYAFKKVDEKKVLRNRLFKKYYGLRPGLINWYKQKVSKVTTLGSTLNKTKI